MSKFVVIGGIEQTFRYEIEADSIEVAQDVAAEKAYDDFGSFDTFSVDDVYQDGVWRLNDN